MEKSKKGLIMVLISGFVFGTMPRFVTLCYEQGATATMVIIFRHAILTILLLPSVIKAKNSMQALRENWKSLLCLIGASAITPLLLYNAYNYLPTGTVTTIHFLYPTVVMVLCVAIFHDKISKIKLICLVLCIIGIFVLLDTSGYEISLLGLGIALLSSVTWAIYIVGLDKFKLEGLSKEQLLFFISCGSVLFMAFLYGPISGTLSVDITPLGWALLVLTNLVISVLGTMFFSIGVRYTDAQTSAIASTLEPITSIFVGILFLHEPFTVRTAIGAVMILSAIILLSVYGEKENR